MFCRNAVCIPRNNMSLRPRYVSKLIVDMNNELDFSRVKLLHIILCDQARRTREGNVFSCVGLFTWFLSGNARYYVEEIIL